MKLTRRYFLKVFGVSSILFGVNQIVSPTKILANEGLETKLSDINNHELDKEYRFSTKELNKYQNMVSVTLKKSQNEKSNAIVIDKADYTLNLIKNGELHSQYPIELGFNPYDDKIIEGDGCTPEGFYKVSWKRDIGQTAFYRAFLLDYPNDIDHQKFNYLKSKEIIPSHCKIGSHIEIHGYGSGKAGNNDGNNWTLGCIALSNKNIDKLFPSIKNGTDVTIVKYGSNQILQKKP